MVIGAGAGGVFKVAVWILTPLVSVVVVVVVLLAFAVVFIVVLLLRGPACYGLRPGFKLLNFSYFEIRPSLLPGVFSNLSFPILKFGPASFRAFFLI